MTTKEQSIAEYEQLKAEMEAQGYREEKKTISAVMANVLALVTALPFAAVFYVAYLWLWGYEGSGLREPVIALVLFLVSIPIHEGLHGLGWVRYCQNGWNSIRFGLIKELLTPYCHCGEALEARQYIVGLLLPFLVLGILPCAVALLAGNQVLIWVGAVNILGAGGDTTIACYLLGCRKERIVDHPTECGFVVFRRR